MQKYSSNFVLQTLLVPFIYANGKASSRSKMDGQDIAGGDILLKDGHRIGNHGVGSPNHGVGSPDHFQEFDFSMLYYLSHSHFT